MSEKQKKNSIFLYITKELKEELFLKNNEFIKKNEPCKFGLFFVLKLDHSGNPIAVIRKYIEDGEKGFPTENGKILPFFCLFPFFLLEKKYFKCDNCNIPGQVRGYYMRNNTNVPYTFCPLCTEGV